MWIPSRLCGNKVCEIAGKEYHKDHQDDVSIRLITDHIRSATFMISDGIMPTNEGRGYVLRRLIRRAARHGRLLGIDRIFLSELSASVIQGSKDGYPELEEKKEFIFNVLNNEEKQFNKTIDQGLRILSDLEEKMAASGEKILSGEDAFRLYDTYGFPMGSDPGDPPGEGVRHRRGGLCRFHEGAAGAGQKRQGDLQLHGCRRHGL